MKVEILKSIRSEEQFERDQVIYRDSSGGLLSLERDSDLINNLDPKKLDLRKRPSDPQKPYHTSGVWRFREGVLNIPDEEIISYPEGNTNLYYRTKIASYVECEEVYLKHEGENPTGSFKDRGMTVAVTQAKRLGVKNVGCASTGNTSASLAAYAALAGLQAFVFIPKGKVAKGKLAQAVGYGAKIVEIEGSFDDAMQMVQKASAELGIYLVNSVNPFRLEGQKTIMWELFQDLRWQAPDWVVLPGGNLGNTSAFGKAIGEAMNAGWIKNKPRLAVIQAEGASPFYRAFCDDFSKQFKKVEPETVATAIRIGDPVNYEKAIGSIRNTDGLVDFVTDKEILEAKDQIDKAGVGCEPASAASVAGLRKLRKKGVIGKNERVVCVLTGHILKDADIIMEYSEPSQFINTAGDMEKLRYLCK